MRIELPEGYVPPEPTHPHYGYLTPQERADLETVERAQVGIVPGVEPPDEMVEVVEVVEVVEMAEPGETAGIPEADPEAGPEARPEAGPEEGRTRHTGWVPSPPSPPGATVTATTSEAPAAPEVEPAAAARAEMRWDAYRQEWVTAEEADPPPDVAAAGGRGSSSSWTSADGQRFRWDARAQQWVTEPAER